MDVIETNLRRAFIARKLGPAARRKQAKRSLGGVSWDVLESLETRNMKRRSGGSPSAARNELISIECADKLAPKENWLRKENGLPDLSMRPCHPGPRGLGFRHSFENSPVTHRFSRPGS